jgi:DNA-binding NarL/FixJ family response regulator
MNIGVEREIRVMVVDDHDLFRAGLSLVLASRTGFEVVAQASGGRMAVQLARELRPQVILMDLRMPDLDGEDATRMIVENDPGARVVVLTVADDENAVAGAIQAGACGYLIKDAPIDEVVQAARAAAGGIGWLSSQAAGALLERARRGAEKSQHDPSALDSLTSRELDVLRLLAQGQENREIAGGLGISPRTVKNHVSSILAKLGVTNRVKAAVFAVQRGVS